MVVVLLALAGCDSDDLCDGCVLVEGMPEVSQITSLTADREGRLVAAVDSPIGNQRVFAARMDRSGVLDPSFGTGGLVELAPIWGSQGLPLPSMRSSFAVVAMTDGAIRVGGEPELRHGATAILGATSDGVADGLRLEAPEDLGTATGTAISLMERDGALVVAYGASSFVHFATHLVRYTAAGEPDPSFPVIPVESAVAMAPDGGFVMGSGYFPEGGTKFVVRRVTRDGQPDTTFAGGARVSIAAVRAMPERFVSVAPSAAGGMILAGVALEDSHPTLLVARWDATGQLDPRFGSGQGFAIHDVIGPGTVSGVVEAADGGIVVVGSRCDDDGACFATAVRLSSDGTLDRTFGDNGVVVVDSESSHFTSVIAMPDGDVVAAGRAFPGSLLPVALFARFPAR